MKDEWLEYCLGLALGPHKLSGRDISKLKNFYMLQRELSLALSEAKPLGICRINSSVSRILGNKSTSKEDSKEMSS